MNQKSIFSTFFLLTLVIGLFSCSKSSTTSGSGGSSGSGSNVTTITDTITFVSTPNPNIFPLLLALADNPSLKVKIIPVAEGSDLTSKLSSGEADGMTSMSYIAAKQVTTGKVPDLQLFSVTYWSGFYEIADKSINNFNDLKGKHLIISGPVGNGKNGGPDIIFQAAMKRLGINPTTDFQLEYLPLADGTAKISNNQADAILLAEPAGTGLVLFNLMNQNKFKKAINLQAVFTGFTGWPLGQMPVGGLSFKSSILSNAAKKATFDLVKKAYDLKAAQIMNASLTDAKTIADKFNLLYASMLPQPIPAAIIVSAIKQGTLIFNNDKSVQTIKTELDMWVKELLGSSPGDTFYQ